MPEAAGRAPCSSWHCKAALNSPSRRLRLVLRAAGAHVCAHEGRRDMQGAVLYGLRDVRFEKREDPKIVKPTDAVIRIAAACICGSDLWPYRGVQPVAVPTPF